MAVNQITPKEMFSTIGSTMNKVVSENKSETHNRVCISKIKLEMSMEVSSDLQLTALPNNQILQLDGHSKKSFFKIKVAAY